MTRPANDEIGQLDTLPSARGEVVEPGGKIHRYVVLKRLGAGGMGVVYSAYDPELDRTIALKLVRKDVFDAKHASEGRARLQREAQALAKLSHPNVVPVFDVGSAEDQLFIAMEFVEGGTLGEWCRTPRTWREILKMYAAAGSGLSAAHKAGIVHRDFKPDNVLVAANGTVRVTDFGLARRSEEAPVSSPEDALRQLAQTVTAAGALLGTPAYMSPEQLRGRAADARSDQFSFCVALYEALAGQRPFSGERVEDLLRDIEGQKPRPPLPDRRVPARVLRLLERGLAVTPEDRHPNMDALLAALSDDPVARWRPRLLWSAAALLIAGLVAAPYLQDWYSRIEPLGPLPPEMTAPALQTAFSAAMREAFIEGKITDADCAEHPCIVFGEANAEEQLDAMKQASSVRPYAKDSWVWHSRDSADVPGKQYFAIALLLPEDAPRRAQIIRRLRVRWNRGAQRNGWPD